MPEHHPVFAHFARKPAPLRMWGNPVFLSDSFLGTVSRAEFTAQTTREGPGAVGVAGLPAFNEEYFEWIDLLESVQAANEIYTFMELGAGYGRWSVRAAFAAGLERTRLVAVEAEPTHYQWMLQHCRDNGLGIAPCIIPTLVEAAISDTPGECLFLTGRPAEWYGQRIATLNEEGCFRVLAVTLPELLRPHQLVDLIDVDIQGQEYLVIRAGLDELNAKVKRLHIATHSVEIERDLRDLLLVQLWEPVWDYECGKTQETPFGPIEFLDGVQSWVNQRFL